MGRGLGRGFESLIPTEVIDDEFDPTIDEDVRMRQLEDLPIDKIHPDPNQPRKNFDEKALQALASSIREHGVLQPIVVTKTGKGGYQIVAGERRYRASKIADKKTIPAIIRSHDDQSRLEVSLIENVQREDLNAIELATAYAKLRNQFNMSLEEISVRIGKSVSSINNTMRLLKLPLKIKEEIVAHGLKEGQVRPLVGMDEGDIQRILPRILHENLSARDVEQLKVRIKKGEALDDASQTEIRKIEKKLGVKVVVRSSNKGSGSVIISFKSQDELKKIIDALA
ncbi:MAG: ParB/RepB/Spo0J family partition protein [Candidatus Nomurabacteria bacterium]|jgi:ParB family chromosome partitioning protein|nr:ParB/RepB/Spo0J family partition protein [Candidatus Nomurabacteria bacterium]